MKAKGILIIILILIALILIIQNAGVVPIQLFFWRIWLSRIVLIIIMLAIGFGIGFVLAKFTGRKSTPPGKV
jgi:uncharacterized integral membrane protein